MFVASFKFINCLIENLKKISFHVYKSRLKLITAILKKKIMPSEFFVKVSLRKERFLGAFNACISIISKNRFF